MSAGFTVSEDKLGAEAREDRADSGSYDVDVVNVALLLAATSKLLFRFRSLPIFKDASVGLTEWVALSVIAKKNGISSKALAKALGIPGKRSQQLIGALSTAGFVTQTKTSQQVSI